MAQVLRAAANAEGDRPRHGPHAWRGYAGALVACLAVAFAVLPLHPALDLVNIVMVFQLVVLGVALAWGPGPAALSAVVNVLAFDYLFVPPRFSFAVHEPQHLVTFAAMLVVGLVVGQLTARLRLRADRAAGDEERARRLFDLAGALSGAIAREQVTDIGERFLADARIGRARVLALDEAGALVAGPSPSSSPPIDLAQAREVLTGGATAPAGDAQRGRGVGPMYLPLAAAMRTRGVLVVEPVHALVPEQRRLLETSAALIAIALERVHFVDVAQRALVAIESERLRNAVLAALSHDLRTPLTVLVGLADTLVRKLADDDAQDEAAAIRDQARRTGELVDKLLAMARLQAGGVRLREDWQSLEELVGSALGDREALLLGRAIAVDLAPDLPLVRCDAVLIERVLVNLLENAAKYTPPGSPIRIGATVTGDRVEVAVEDRGPGLPSGREAAIFDKFTRGDPESSVPGVGLGLAFGRAVAEAHGGTLRGESREGGGARFVLALPLAPAPVLEPETSAGAAPAT